MHDGQNTTVNCKTVAKYAMYISDEMKVEPKVVVLLMDQMKLTVVFNKKTGFSI